MIAAGRLDCLLQLESCSKDQAAASGEITRKWPPDGGVIFARIWGEALDRRTLERFLGQQFVAEVEVGWQVRWRQDLADRVSPNEDVRLVVQGRAYDILGVFEPPGTRRMALVIRAKARAE